MNRSLLAVSALGLSLTIWTCGESLAETLTKQVQFDAGASGAELTWVLAPGNSARYVLGARNLQNLYVRVAHENGSLDYQIFNPDGPHLGPAYLY